MNILHYALGFSPFRTGGMTKFCMDIMRQQVMDGHQSALLWPGRMKLWEQKVSIRDNGIYMINNSCGIRSFEIINPLPVPYDEGISEFHFFEKDSGRESYKELFCAFKPDVIHIHTLMGLHRSFLETAREYKIRCVFTTHDYFPICPKTTLFRDGQICASAMSCSDCAKCNETSLSMRKIYILQSSSYRFFKDSLIVRSLRKQHRDNYLYDDRDSKVINAVRAEADYRKLRSYYATFLQLMDCVHYNSTVSKTVYEKFFILPESEVINIGHADISDNRKKKNFFRQKLRITYLGPQGEAKGFFVLKRALDKLWETRHDFCLNIFFMPTEMSSYMNPHRRYDYSELECIFDDTDIVVVPSLWQETFGYVVLEALSYGVPVLTGRHTGACDIIEPGAGIILDDINAENLYNSLSSITAEQLSNMNEIICKKQNIPRICDVAKLLEERCYH